MANCKSAKKRIITNAKRQKRNSAYKSKLKTLLSNAAKQISDKSDARQEAVKKTIQFIDMVSGKGILHKNNAARKKSKLVKALSKSA